MPLVLWYTGGMTESHPESASASNTAAKSVASKASKDAAAVANKVAAASASESEDFSVSPAPAPPAAKRVLSSKGHVVSKGETDEVLVSRLIFGASARKSLSIHHLQRRLADLGYPEASADIDGHGGDLTARSVADWQKDNGYDVGAITREQATALFDGDPNVTVVLDTMI